MDNSKIVELPIIDDAIKDINITPHMLGELKQNKILYSDDLMENAGKTLLKLNHYNYKHLAVYGSWNPKISDIDHDYKVVFLKTTTPNKTFWSIIIIIKDGESILYYCNNQKFRNQKDFEENIQYCCPMYGECGLYALVYLCKIVLKNMKKTMKNRLETTLGVNKINKNKITTNDVDEIRNNDQTNVKQIKDTIWKQLHQEMTSTINEKTLFVSQNKEFMKEYHELINIALEFKQENNINQQYIEMLSKPKTIEQDQLKQKLIDDLKNMQNFIKKGNDENQVTQFSIKEKYPKEIQCITTVLNIVNNYGDNERLIKMKEICEKLSLPAEKVTEYLQVTSSVKEDSNSSSRPVINNDIPIKNTSCCNSSLNQDENDCIIKKLEDLIREIEECEINKNYKLCKNNELKSKYDKFNVYWSDWKEKHIQDIKVWINDLERRSMIMDDPPCFYEALAVLNRAFELCIGHALRLPQILALILFNQKSSDSGLLCQIQTGEGKTYIIAATAILKILLENKNSIDIITSNNVLARHAVSATKNLYQLFNITVDINAEFKSDQKACYNANVVYGSMSDFQFDFLNHDFNGLGTRMNRKFEYVILDEVDNMLIDNGGNIAKLAEIFPGMENLIYIYIEIWKDLNIFINKTFDDINIKPDKELIQCKISEWKNLIQNKIENNIESFLIPLHLMEYVQNVLPKWIDNAIYAKYDCIENIHYVIQTENKDDGEQIIVPVDYTNTGVTLKNTMWSHGLHQFLQLKHNLQVHAENLTSCCISNYAYIRKYGTNLIGLTGTIGGEGEQDLLKAIYQVDFISLPTFKIKQFEKYPEIIVPDIEWLDKIIEQCFYMLLQKRAVLVVCLTIADANDVYNELIQLKSTYIDLNPTIQKYLSENESHVTDEFIDSGTIIVATNIAGRGTDFKTTKQLEDHGGLHICVTFCPESKRVQDQVFYRTSRQGNKGSAGLILSESQVADIMKDDGNYEFHEISKRIHDDELVYMEYLKTFKSKELYFEDCLFNLFSNLYKQARTNKLNVFARKDLKEYWAFWFEKQEFLSITNFEEIENEAHQLFEIFQEDDKIQEILKGHIEHNPYYDIHRAHAYISEQNLAKAEECLNNSLEMTNDTLSEAHYLLFEVSMERGGVVMNQIKDILTNVGLGYLIKMNKDSEYKNKCMEHLEKARSILIKEIQFIENYFNCDEFYTIFNGSLDKNLFIKHLHSKLICLKMFHENINLIHDTIQKNADTDLMITMKNDDIQRELESEPETVKTIKKDFITKEETINLSLRGLKCLFNVGEIKTVPKEVFIASGLQIALGCAALGLGWFFPFIMEYAQTIAATLIAEGILDIIICLIGGKIAFDWNYFKSKLITFGIMTVSLGITALGGYINKLISKARSFLKMDNLMSLIKMVPGVDSIMNGIGNVLQKAQSFINMANKNFIPNGILSKPLLNTLWQACNKVGRFLIVSNIIDTNIQNRFLKGWETLYEAIKGIVSTDFIGKLNTTILTILSCKKGYDLLMSKLGSLNVLKYIQTSDLKQIVEKVIIYSDMWELCAAFFGSISCIVEKCTPFLKQLKLEIENTLKTITNDTKDTDNYDENYLNDGQIRITETIFNAIQNKVNYHMSTNIRKRKNNADNENMDGQEILKQTNPYDVLNLKQTCVNIDDVHQAFTKLSLQYRPGTGTDQESSQVFEKIQWAYNEIKNNLM